MKLINLLPKSVVRELQLDLIAGQILNFWIGLFLTFGIFFALIWASIFYLKTEIQNTDNDISQQREVLSSANTKDLQVRVSNLNKKINTIEELRDNHYYWSEALTELVTLMPSDMQIDSLIIKRETGKIDMTGSAANRDSVLLFWANVKKSQYFRDINFPLANLQKATDDPYSFTFYIKPEAIQHASST